ncbi:MAG: YcbK family protein [Mesorhizobium sp.]
MKPAGSRLAKGKGRAVLAALFSVLLASCTSTGMTEMSAGMPGYTANAPTADTSGASPDTTASSEGPSVTGEQSLMTAEGNTELPAEVAYLPSPSPGAGFVVAEPAGADAIAGSTPAPLQAGAQEPAAQAVAAAPAPQPEATQPTAALDDTALAAASETPKPQAYAAPKKKGFLASLFGGSRTEAPAPAVVEINPAREAVKPVLASVEVSEKPLIVDANEINRASINGSLPGVRQTALFEIRRKSGVDDESDVDLHEDEGAGLYQVASAAGLARLAPNGLLKQTESVDVACLKPSLVRVLKMIEGHYGKKMIVTSGFRDPNRNRRANGARNSLHMYCAAADVQIPGVSKWELASYVRSMPGRGGVGTYCHTESVHIDVGPERDWNWRCRRRK